MSLPHVLYHVFSSRHGIFAQRTVLGYPWNPQACFHKVGEDSGRSQPSFPVFNPAEEKYTNFLPLHWAETPLDSGQLQLPFGSTWFTLGLPNLF